jgi:Tfp pilus assembly protein PilE
MNTKTKFLVRVVVLVAVLAWPAVETWRLWDTNQKLKDAQALQRTVQTKYEAARAKHTQVAGAPDTTPTPPAKP